jgi:SanA protein
MERRARPYIRERLDGERRRWAIVLGCALGPDEEPGAMLEDRLALGLRAMEAGAVESVLVSGGPETPVMGRWLRSRGVASDRLVEDPLGVRTLATMERAARVFGIRDAIVCTQRFHLPRAVLLARHHGIDAVGVPADRRRYARFRRNLVRERFARVLATIEMLRR